MTRAEKKHIEQLIPDIVRQDSSHGPVFQTSPETGACVMRCAVGCQIHADFGEEHKPGGCRRFPYGLVATPDGGRITTQHRCPCRSMGDRPAILPASAQSSLSDSAGRLQADGRVQGEMLLDRHRGVDFENYVALEARHMDSLLAGEEPAAVLAQRPLDGLSLSGWRELAGEIASEPDETAYSAAEAWFARALCSLLPSPRDGLRTAARPWADSFDRACNRSGSRSAAEVFADWVCDVIWSLDWYFVSDRDDQEPNGTYAQGCRELVTRHAVALRICEHLAEGGLEEGRAAAEAVTIVELAGQGSVWQEALPEI